MAESGKFMTKAEIRFRGIAVSNAHPVAIIFDPVCEPGFFDFRRTSPSVMGAKGSSNARRAIERMKSRPSSQKTRTRSLT